MILSPRWRKFLLMLHLTTSVGLAGAVAGFLAMAVTGLTTGDAALAGAVYPAMSVMTWTVILPLAVASLIIGVIQSLGTPWGLVRYYWVIVKLVLTVIALGVLMLQLEGIDLVAKAALMGQLDAAPGPRFSMVLHGAGGLTVLLDASLLAIYKPRGTTGHGARAIAAGR